MSFFISNLVWSPKPSNYNWQEFRMLLNFSWLDLHNISRLVVSWSRFIRITCVILYDSYIHVSLENNLFLWMVYLLGLCGTLHTLANKGVQNLQDMNVVTLCNSFKMNISFTWDYVPWRNGWLRSSPVWDTLPYIVYTTFWPLHSEHRLVFTLLLGSTHCCGLAILGTVA